MFEDLRNRFAGNNKDDVTIKPCVVDDTPVGHEVTSATELLTEPPKPDDGIVLRKRTVVEQKQEMVKNRDSTGATTVLYRKMRLNLDILQLIAYGLVCAFIGWGACLISMSFSMTQITVSIRNFFEMLFSIASASILFMWRLYTPPGAIAKMLIRSGNKTEEQLDTFGRTIVGNGK